MRSFFFQNCGAIRSRLAENNSVENSKSRACYGLYIRVLVKINCSASIPPAGDMPLASSQLGQPFGLPTCPPLPACLPSA